MNGQFDFVLNDPRIPLATLVWNREEALDLIQRVNYLNALRTILHKRIKLVSDFDLRHALPEECEAALTMI